MEGNVQGLRYLASVLNILFIGAVTPVPRSQFQGGFSVPYAHGYPNDRMPLLFKQGGGDG